MTSIPNDALHSTHLAAAVAVVVRSLFLPCLPNAAIRCSYFYIGRTRPSQSIMSTSAILPDSLLLSVLSRVPGLLTIIAPYLFPRHKLCALSRLCHRFPPLSPACFRHDRLDISDRPAVVLPYLSQGPPVLTLLSHIRHLHCMYKVGHIERTAVNRHFFHLLHPTFLPSSPPLCAFPCLRSLAVTVPYDNPSFVQHLFASSPSWFPHLSTLDLGCESTEMGDLLPLDVRVLSRHLPSLTSLTLRSCAMGGRSFMTLCSMPLVKLDCTDQCDVYADDEAEQDEHAGQLLRGVSGEAGIASSLRVLLLPNLLQVDDEPYSQFKLVDRLLTVYARAEPKENEEMAVVEVGDESVRLPNGLITLQLFDEHIPAATLHIIAQIRTLTWLDLSDCHVRSLAPLVDEHDAPCLPVLKHFDAPLAIATEWEDAPGEHDMEGVEAERRGNERDYAGILCLYAPQLHLLQLNLPMDRSLLDSGVAMLRAAFSASDLRELSLGVWYAEEDNGTGRDGTWIDWCAYALPYHQPLPVLHHVGDLVLYGLPLNDDELSCLLQLLPNVQDCRLADMPYLSLGVLPICGRACSKLRKLELIAERDNLFLTQPLTGSAWTTDEQTAVLFPSLLIFAVAGRYTDLQYDKAHLQPLARLLAHSAPNLRYLYLDIDCPLPLLVPFFALSFLRAFRAFLQLPCGLSRFFRRPPIDERCRIWTEHHRDRPQYECEVMCVEEMEYMEAVRDVRPGWDKQSEKERDDCYVFASGNGGWGGGGWDVEAAEALGQWGRREFFEALQNSNTAG